MIPEQFYHFSADYFSVNHKFFVQGRFKRLQGAVLDDWRADYTLVVYYQYCSGSTVQDLEAERCVYISFTKERYSVIDIAGSENRNTAFFAWLTDVICNEMKAKQFTTLGGKQHQQLQIAW